MYFSQIGPEFVRNQIAFIKALSCLGYAPSVLSLSSVIDPPKQPESPLFKYGASLKQHSFNCAKIPSLVRHAALPDWFGEGIGDPWTPPSHKTVILLGACAEENAGWNYHPCAVSLFAQSVLRAGMRLIVPQDGLLSRDVPRSREASLGALEMGSLNLTEDTRTHFLFMPESSAEVIEALRAGQQDFLRRYGRDYRAMAY